MPAFLTYGRDEPTNYAHDNARDSGDSLEKKDVPKKQSSWCVKSGNTLQSHFANTTFYRRPFQRYCDSEAKTGPDYGYHFLIIITRYHG